MPFQISGRYQTNHPGQYQCIMCSIIIAHKQRQCLDIISVLSVWERSRVIWLMLSLWFMKGRLQYLIVCVCVCVMGRRDSWGSVWSRKLILLHARWAGSGPVNPCVQYRNVLHFISGVLLMFYVMTNPFHWTVNKCWVEIDFMCERKCSISWIINMSWLDKRDMNLAMKWFVTVGNVQVCIIIQKYLTTQLLNLSVYSQVFQREGCDKILSKATQLIQMKPQSW